MPSALAAQSRQRYGASMAGRNLLPAICASCSRDLLHVVEELEEHDPGEHRQPVEVAVEPLVLAHDVAADLTMERSRWAVVRGWVYFVFLLVP